MDKYIYSVALFLKSRSKYIATMILILAIFIIPLKTDALLVPQVYLTELDISKNSFEPMEEIEGKVSLWNYEKFLVSDLVFHFQLLGEEVDGVHTQLIDEQKDIHVFFLTPGEKKTKSFSYLLPQNLPNGTFKFRIQLVNSRGEEMSWIDKIINIGGGGKFLTLDNEWIIKDGQDMSSGGGVDYLPDEICQVRFDVSNNSSFTISAFYKIITYKRSIGQILKEEKKENLILKPGEKQTINTNLSKMTEPESYLSEIRFYNSEEEPISNSIYFRWIISGEEDAEILFVNPDKDSYQAGEEADIWVQYTGPAHFELEDVKEGVLMVDLYDKDGSLVGQGEKNIELKPGQAIISVGLEKDVSNLVIETKIVKQGNILDEYEIQLKQAKASETIIKPGFFEKNKKALFFLILAVILILIIYFSKKMKILKSVILLILLGIGVLSGNYVLAATEVTGGCCDTTTIFNSPTPNKNYNLGDIINFSGKFRVSSCGNGLFFNKITFYIAEDKEIPIKDCCGHTIDSCSPGTSCLCSEGCLNAYGAESENYSKDEIRNIKWCDEVKYLDTTKGYKIYKLGEIYPSDVNSGARPYWVEYSQDYIIPADLGFFGPVRLYVQYSGTHWKNHWHWNIAYQKANINSPPKALISCDPSGCNSSDCIGYTGCPFTLNNNSTDPNGQSDIVKSEWDILGWGSSPDISCTVNPLCNYTVPVITPDNYTIQLYIEDSSGNSNIATKGFTIKKEASAGFVCSFDNEDWLSCDDILLSQDQIIYLSDSQPNPLEHSLVSEGALMIVSRKWEIVGGAIFDQDNESDIQISLEQDSTVRLTIVDDNGRSHYKDHKIGVNLPLPEWEEAIP